MISGTLAAALTPLRDGGTAVDPDSVDGYVDYLAAGGVDGVFALGSTGEGILLEPAERRLMAERFREATAGRLALAVHAGAISTPATVALAEHAASIGADAVVAIGPPYYAYTDEGLLAHFAAAAAACDPVPFFVYELAARSGYAIPVEVIERLRERAPNLAGLKVSDKPFSAVEPYLLEGLAIFVGFEPLIPEGLAAGAVGSVSAVAAVHPDVIVDLVRNPSAEAARRVDELRSSLEPLVPNGKAELARRGPTSAGRCCPHDPGVGRPEQEVAVICLDPGHGTAPAAAVRTEPIGPGSTTLKIADGGGTAGEAPLALQIALRTRIELERRGFTVVMTRTGPGYRGGNVARARFCNRHHAALMLRIHADGSDDPSRHGISTLTPALHRGWTDDVYAASRRAARLVQRALVVATGAADAGVVERPDLTGFNWADVPVILVETGFLTNTAERSRLLDRRYRLRVARGLAAGVGAFVRR